MHGFQAFSTPASMLFKAQLYFCLVKTFQWLLQYRAKVKICTMAHKAIDTQHLFHLIYYALIDHFIQPGHPASSPTCQMYSLMFPQSRTSFSSVAAWLPLAAFAHLCSHITPSKDSFHHTIKKMQYSLHSFTSHQFFLFFFSL